MQYLLLLQLHSSIQQRLALSATLVAGIADLRDEPIARSAEISVDC
jgi:hypothetical protein